MDSNPLNHLEPLNYDVLTYYNYNNLDIEDLAINEIEKYSDIILIGWSMGVWTANYFSGFLPEIKQAIAINGTLLPIDDNYGIPRTIFQATLDNFKPETREKFYKRMFSTNEDFNRFLKHQPERKFNDQKAELVALQSHIQSVNSETKILFTKAIIGKSDKIIPSKNQISFWQDRTSVSVIDASHYPFYLWNSWEDLIQYASSD
jgi:biotin synthesis protein BioG